VKPEGKYIKEEKKRPSDSLSLNKKNKGGTEGASCGPYETWGGHDALSGVISGSKKEIVIGRNKLP